MGNQQKFYRKIIVSNETAVTHLDKEATLKAFTENYFVGKLVYQAQSPDEEALVGAARNFGFVFKSRSPSTVTIDVVDKDGEIKEEVYKLLCILDFNNVRKRMSVSIAGKSHIICYYYL